MRKPTSTMRRAAHGKKSTNPRGYPHPGRIAQARASASPAKVSTRPDAPRAASRGDARATPD